MEPTLLFTLKHSSPVSSVAIMPDGSRVITGTRNNVIFIWDATNGTALKSCRGHLPPHQICALACTHDSKRFASGGRDCTMCIWDREGKLLKQVKWKHRSFVTSLTYADDHRYLVSAGADGMIRIWNPYKEKIAKTLEKGHGGPVTALAVSKDHKFVVSGGDDKMVFIWTPEAPLGNYGTRCAGKLYRTIGLHSAEVTGVAITTDNMHVVSSSLDKTVRITFIHDGQCIHTLNHPSAVRSMSLSRDDKWILTGTSSGTAYLWQFDNAQQICSFKAHTEKVLGVAITPSGLAVTAGNDQVAKIWQFPICNSVNDVPVNAEPEAAVLVAMTPDGKLVADPAAWPAETNDDVEDDPDIHPSAKRKLPLSSLMPPKKKRRGGHMARSSAPLKRSHGAKRHKGHGRKGGKRGSRR